MSFLSSLFGSRRGAADPSETLRRGMQKALSMLKHEKDLPREAMENAMEAIVGGLSNDDEIEKFLRLLQQKGETAPEIAAAAKVMRRHAVKLSKPYTNLLDTCGTGGDAKNLFNVSTLTALTVAAAGVRVAKHGNRSVSSACGSADLLESLGVRVDLPPAGVEACLDKTGFGFFFAPTFHPAMRLAMPARKRVQGKTIFNLLGPLSNPAGADMQLIGVYDESLVNDFASVLMELGAKKALIVHGMDGTDEITLCDRTLVAEVIGGAVNGHFISPEDFDLLRAPLSSLQAASKEAAKVMALKVLAGERGAPTDVVCLNAGAALFLADRAISIKDGINQARERLKSGDVRKKLDEVAAFTQGFAAK